METAVASCFWKSRSETADDCANRALIFFRLLSDHGQVFRHWRKTGRSAQSAQANAVDTSHLATVHSLFQSGRLRRDLDNAAMEELGFAIGLWNGEVGSLSAKLRIHCGIAASTTLLNSVVLHFPSPMAEDQGELLGLLDNLIESWDPDFAQIYRDDQEPFLYGRTDSFAGSALYLRSGLLPPSQLPKRFGPHTRPTGTIYASIER